jgi:hypothetical protein
MSVISLLSKQLNNVLDTNTKNIIISITEKFNVPYKDLIEVWNKVNPDFKVRFNYFKEPEKKLLFIDDDEPKNKVLTIEDDDEPKKKVLTIEDDDEPKKKVLTIEDDDEPKKKVLTIEDDDEPKNKKIKIVIY